MVSAYERLALHTAVSAGSVQPKDVKHRLGLCPGDVRRADVNGRLPLHLAVMCPFKNTRDKTKILKLLIKAHPEAVRIQDRNGELPLHIAARRSNQAAIRLLCKSYPEAAMVKNNDGCFPIDLVWTSFRAATRSLSITMIEPHNSIAEKWQLMRALSTAKSKALAALHEINKACPTVLPQKINDHRPTIQNILRYPVVSLCYSGIGSPLETTAIKKALHFDPVAARARDANGDYPLNLYLDQFCGSSIEQSHLKLALRMIDLCPEALTWKSRNTGYFPLTVIMQNAESLAFSYTAAVDFLDDLSDKFPEVLKLSSHSNPIPIALLLNTALNDVTTQSKNDEFILGELLSSSPWDQGRFKKMFAKTFHVLTNNEYAHYNVPIVHMIAINGFFIHPLILKGCLKSILANDQMRKESQDFAKRLGGGFMALDKEGNLPLHLACKGQSCHTIWPKCLLDVSTQQESLINCVSNDMFDICLRGIDGISVDIQRVVRTKNIRGQLPLHVLLKSTIPNQIKFSRVRILLTEYPEAVSIQDPTTNLFPFMVSAVADTQNGDCNKELMLACITDTFNLLCTTVSYLDMALSFGKR